MDFPTNGLAASTDGLEPLKQPMTMLVGDPVCLSTLEALAGEVERCKAPLH